MSSYSTYGKYIYIPATETVSNRPLSARKMCDLSNNLQYLQDSSAQQRICWSRLNNADTANVLNGAYFVFISLPISWAWMTSFQPFAAHILVCGMGSGATPSVELTAVIHNINSYYYTREEAIDNCIYSIDGSTVSTTDTEIINALSELKTEPALGSLASNKRAYTASELEDDGDAISRPVDHPEFMFTIWARGEGYINQIQLREFHK